MLNLIKKANDKWLELKNTVNSFEKRNISKIDKKNFVLIGMRRMGKTTLFKHISNKYKKDEVLFVSLDNPLFFDINFQGEGDRKNLFLESIIRIIELENKKIVLIDEIQNLKNWSTWLKGMVDYFPNVRFIATGSDALELEKNAENGVGRFSIFYTGIYTWNEYVNTYGDNFNEYINNFSFPEGKQMNEEERYTAIYEKQIVAKKSNPLNVNALLKIIAINPGHSLTNKNIVKKITLNSLSKIINEETDSKMKSRQIEKIINFLIDSEIIISIKDIDMYQKTSKQDIYTLYPADWNLYQLFTTNKKYEELNENTVPKKGFIFENMIISNVYSILNTRLKRLKIFNKVSQPDLDIIIDDKNYEIKSFDVSKIDIQQKSDILDKSKSLNSIIIHDGPTMTLLGTQLLNWKEFLVNLENEYK